MSTSLQGTTTTGTPCPRHNRTMRRKAACPFQRARTITRFHAAAAERALEPAERAVPAVPCRWEHADLAVRELIAPKPSVAAQDRDAGPLRHHAYTPPRASNFAGTNPTWSSAASTPASRIGALVTCRPVALP